MRLESIVLAAALACTTGPARAQRAPDVQPVLEARGLPRRLVFSQKRSD